MNIAHSPFLKRGECGVFKYALTWGTYYMANSLTVGPLNPERNLPGTLLELVKLITEHEWEELTEEDKANFPTVEDDNARICRLEGCELILTGNLFAVVTQGGLDVVYELAINQVDYF